MALSILQPVMALVLLNCTMLVWLYILRVPAVAKLGITLDPTLPRGQQMMELPPRVRWKADNYNHLLEQPVLFYVVCMVMAITGLGSDLNLQLAWAYVVLRVIHSLHQALWNHIMVRFSIFALSSIILIVLAVRVALAIF